MNKKVLVTSMLLSLGTAAVADSTQDEIALLKEQLKMLTAKIEKLEEKASNNESKVAEETSKKSSSWTERITFSGDIRDRFEYIDERGKDVRTRNRIRFRLGATAEVNDDLSVGFRLASGGDDPTSTNQTLDDAFSTKGIQLDLAYFDYKLTDALTLTGGKMKNPFYIPAKTPVFWDGDLNPEGFALGFDNDGWEGVLAGFSVDERSSADDVLLFGGQLTKTVELGEGKLVAGLGYYDYQELQGSTPLYDGKARGNTLDAAGKMAYDFNIFEGLIEYKTNLASLPFSVFATYYQNTEADDLDTGYALGFGLGKVSDAGSWSLGYSYLDLEADSVYALFNDSDFAGGETDSKGHILKAGYGLRKNMALGLTYISSEQDQSKATQTDYDRLQMDLAIKFK
ncbi:MAG: putative porin [Xanthomonadales bacterium]|nr:putative porin [Xanthomonadales bacterium]